METFRGHMTAVHTVYLQMVELGRLKELEQELLDRSWMQASPAVPTPEPTILDKAEEIMEELRAAVERRHRQGARDALERLRRWLYRIAV